MTRFFPDTSQIYIAESLDIPTSGVKIPRHFQVFQTSGQRGSYRMRCHLPPVLRAGLGRDLSWSSAAHADSAAEFADIRSRRCADIRSNCRVQARYVSPTEGLVRSPRKLHNIITSFTDAHMLTVWSYFTRCAPWWLRNGRNKPASL